MNLYIFDENDIYFRSPGTPIEAPGELRLKIKTVLSEAAGVRVTLYPDGADATLLDMDFIGIEGSYDVYSAELKIEKLPGARAKISGKIIKLIGEI